MPVLRAEEYKIQSAGCRTEVTELRNEQPRRGQRRGDLTSIQMLTFGGRRKEKSPGFITGGLLFSKV
jgi:hypothetical protein